MVGMIVPSTCLDASSVNIVDDSVSFLLNPGGCAVRSLFLSAYHDLNAMPT